MRIRTCLALLLIPAALIAAASTATAQTDTTATAPPTTTVTTTPEPAGGYKFLSGGYLAGAFPMGDWGEIAGFGLALDGASVAKPAGKPFGLRSNFGLLYNFSRTVDVPAGNVGPNDQLSIETKNWSLFFGLGPEFSMPKGDVAPFIFGTVGFDTYWTGSELSGTANGSSYSAKHGDNRIAFAWSAGLGIRKKKMEGVGVEVSAEYRSGIRHDFLLPEDVRVTGAGVTANRDSHSSDQIIVRVGTVLGAR